MKKKDANELLEKYRAGTCTAEEMALLRSWFDQLKLKEAGQLSAGELEEISDEMWQAVAQQTVHKRKSTIQWRYIAAAAAIVVLIAGMVALNLLKQERSASGNSRAIVQQRATPERSAEKATLTLADGNTISLTDAANGAIAKEAGVSITKTADGQLVYNIDGNAAGKTGEYNTIATPRGGQYQVHLPDGSRVWLNAASSLRYPVRFDGSERKVTLKGEAYFEVQGSKTKPFIVESANQTVTVLGTSFNIDAYPETTNTITTLLNGSVRVADADSTGTAILKPGQQSIISKSIRVISTDPTEAIAWKSGYLLLDNEDFTSIMHRIARWYDVEIEYQNRITGLQPGGRISLSRPLAEVLQALEATGKVHFELSGKKLIVKE